MHQVEVILVLKAKCSVFKLVRIKSEAVVLNFCNSPQNREAYTSMVSLTHFQNVRIQIDY